MMNKKLKREWIKNLRSGKFTQGRGFLQNDVGRNCCLGVLCITAGAKYKDNRFILNGEEWLSNDFQSPLSRSLGIPDEMCEKLAHHNDRNMSFKRIAYIIEKTKSF